MRALRNEATIDDSLLLYAEMTPAQIRAAQRRVASGELKRIAPGVLSSAPAEEWPAMVARHRNRVLAALFPGAVIGYRSAFAGGLPVDGGNSARSMNWREAFSGRDGRA